MSASWTTDDFTKELDAAAQFIALRPDAANADAVVSKLCNRIASSGEWSTKEACLLLEHVQKCSLPDEQKGKVQSELERKAVESSNNSCLRLQGTPQSVCFPWNYLSQTEWESLPSLTDSEVICLVVRRLKKIGVKSLKEDTKKWICAMVLALKLGKHEKQPPYLQIFEWVKFMVSAFGAESQCSLVGGEKITPWTQRSWEMSS